VRFAFSVSQEASLSSSEGGVCGGRGRVGGPADVVPEPSFCSGGVRWILGGGAFVLSLFDSLA